jgi:hypothetical protein
MLDSGDWDPAPHDAATIELLIVADRLWDGTRAATRHRMAIVVRVGGIAWRPPRIVAVTGRGASPSSAV